jgi:hypothetical protein
MEECDGTSGIILRVVKQQILYLGWLWYTTQCRGFIDLKQIDPKAWVRIQCNERN